jgi:hypothetical protein
MHDRYWHVRLTGPAIMAFCACSLAQAGLIEDSSVTVTARNFYLDRDFKGTTPYPAAREWAQGFIVKAHSGYTEGTVGFGMDLTALLGLKLDSSPDRTATQLLSFNPQSRKARDEYSELGAALKMQVSRTQLSVGTQFPALPVITGSPARLLPQTFRGAYGTSSDVDQFTLHAGRMDRVNLRDSTDYQPISMASPNGRFRAGAESERFDFIGGDYHGSDALTLRYYYAELEDIYAQHFVVALYTQPLGTGRLRGDMRIFDSRQSGRAEAGNVDNLNAGLMFSYLLGPHSVGVG